MTNGSGSYTFTFLPAGGNYTVTPTKTALPPGAPNINTVDVVATRQQFLQPYLTGCQLTAADVNGDGAVNTIDVIAIRQFFLGHPSANVGKYQFIPANRTYPGIITDQTAQNYNTLVFGDVASHFVE